MELVVRCLTCSRKWKQVIKFELDFAFVQVWDWCFYCQQNQGKAFNKQMEEKCADAQRVTRKSGNEMP